MRLLKATLQNWGVFRSPPSFHLEPILGSDGEQRHLTLISGHNGAGKSTLFQAIAIALHGSLALGDSISHQEYNDFLLSRLHRSGIGNMTASSEESSIALTFRYVKLGHSLEIEVVRQWRRRGTTVGEKLIVLQDGQPPDVYPEDYQTWLNDLIPPGMSSVYLFDAEQLNALANPEHHNGVLGETVRRLTGLDLVERLQADLAYHIRHQGGGGHAATQRQEVLRKQAAYDGTDAELQELASRAEDLSAEQACSEACLSKLEQQLAAEGGMYAARRSILQKELEVVEEEIGCIGDRLRELSADLLPFALVPQLCQTLRHRLTREADARRHEASLQFWEERITYLKAALLDEELWEDMEIPLATRHVLSQRLTDILHVEAISGTHVRQSTLHQLAANNEETLQSWITLALHSIPQEVQNLGLRLDELECRRITILEEISRAPEDEILAPLHEEIQQLEAVLVNLETERRALNENMGKLRFQRDIQERELNLAVERLRAIQSSQRQLELAERSRIALKAYQDTLTCRRLAMLEKNLTVAFNTICRKEHLLREARIDPESFDVQLLGADNHVLGLVDFSAGERQLYAMALMWALRQVSGQQLPLLIDTPLARLDDMHRTRLVRDYLPEVSQQVVLFVTDSELDPATMIQMKPHLAHHYRLDYDPKTAQTVVTDTLDGLGGYGAPE